MDSYTLISGASSGIGEGIALKLSERGNLILCGRDSKKLDAVSNKCCDKYKRLKFACDLSDVSAISSNLEAFLKANDANVDGFVHSAGMSYVEAAKSANLDSLRKMFAVNFEAPVFIVKTLLKRSVNSEALKNIVFISSIISQRPAAGFSLYAASKSALESYMKSLAVEVAPKGIRVNCVRPGAIKTPMTEFMFSDEKIVREMLSKVPLGFGDVSRIAETVDFLMSDSASWITGQALSVDGGMLLL